MTIGGITAAGIINSHGSAALAAFIRIMIGVINVAYVRRHQSLQSPIPARDHGITIVITVVIP
jgi:hypothetical protein